MLNSHHACEEDKHESTRLLVKVVIRFNNYLIVGEPDPQNFEEVVLFTNSFLVFFSLKYESWGARKMMSAQSLLLRTVCKN